jgi:hypothetical protein
MNLSKPNRHLTDDALFALALPAAGQPEALPAHLSDCLACSRALSEWKNAVRDLAAEGEAAIARRTPEGWAAAEQRTMQAIRRSRFAPRGIPVRWAVGIAASILLFALALPIQRAVSHRSAAAAPELSAQDQADDALLRDVARLSRGDDGGNWSSLVPEPGRGDEDHL